MANEPSTPVSGAPEAAEDRREARRTLLRAALAGGAVAATITPSVALAASAMHCGVSVLAQVYRNVQTNEYWIKYANGTSFKLDDAKTPISSTDFMNALNSNQLVLIQAPQIPSDRINTIIQNTNIQNWEVNLIKTAANTPGLTVSGCAASFVSLARTIGLPGGW